MLPFHCKHSKISYRGFPRQWIRLRRDARATCLRDDSGRRLDEGLCTVLGPCLWESHKGTGFWNFILKRKWVSRLLAIMDIQKKIYGYMQAACILQASKLTKQAPSAVRNRTAADYMELPFFIWMKKKKVLSPYNYTAIILTVISRAPETPSSSGLTWVAWKKVSGKSEAGREQSRISHTGLYIGVSMRTELAGCVEASLHGVCQ